jgi:hypothetical protein
VIRPSSIRALSLLIQRGLAVTDELDFDREKFLAMPLKERVREARRFAVRAEEIADRKRSEHYRAYYLEIAIAWLRLADDLERSIALSERSVAH